MTSRGALAWLAVGTSGALMAVSYRGVEGAESTAGIWGPVLFAVPLLAAWYAFDRLDSMMRTYRQTFEALSLAPELAGMVDSGHAERVRFLVNAMGKELGMRTVDLAMAERAALLHHLGQVTLEDPSHGGVHPHPVEIAVATASLFDGIDELAPVGEIIQGAPADCIPASRVGLASQVLRVASAYDELVAVHEQREVDAWEAMTSAPLYLYDARVLASLERVLLSREKSVIATG